MNTLLRLCAPAALVALATGCATLNPPPPVDMPSTLPPVLAPAALAPAQATGSLFSTRSYRPMFEDRRARLLGDLVTINISESVTATQNTKSAVERSSGLQGSITALPLLSSGAAAKIAGKSALGAGYSNTFDGSGQTSNQNMLNSVITAIVTDVLPNGHLVITAERQVGVNRSVDMLRFSGIVDPRQLQPGSVIDSRQVANVRVISRGLGEQAEAQAMGWLSRAFNAVTPF